MLTYISAFMALLFGLSAFGSSVEAKATSLLRGGYKDVKCGMSIKESKIALKNMLRKKYDPPDLDKRSNGSQVLKTRLENGRFLLFFYKDQFYRAQYFPSNETTEQVEAVTNQLKSKYGAPQVKTRAHLVYYQWKDGDGTDIQYTVFDENAARQLGAAAMEESDRIVSEGGSTDLAVSYTCADLEARRVANIKEETQRMESIEKNKSINGLANDL